MILRIAACRQCDRTINDNDRTHLELEMAKHEVASGHVLWHIVEQVGAPDVE